MASFQSKLARLPSMPGGRPAEAPPPAPRAPGVPAASARPSLDELRERIARIVAREPAPPPRANPAGGELPFAVEHTEHGPLYVRRERVVPAARVGRVPLVAARDADAAMLALLALDPGLEGCDPRRALYVDTETTGLAGGTGTVPFLLGLSWFDVEAGAFVIEQCLLRRLGEEAPILSRFAERVAEASMIVTYNGKAFDLPLLRTRYVMNRLAAPAEPPHLDLVHVARRIHKSRLKARTLVAIEAEVLGRLRVGDVAGGDIVATYAHFLRTGDEEALLGVVEHNVADVLAMVALLGLYGEPLGHAPDDEGDEVYAPAGLDGADLADVARTLRRAGALDRAAALAEAAVARGGGAHAVRARGDIAKARGDKARALEDYEALAAEVDDPAVRLELAKLYEHHVKAFEDALKIVERGTGEDDEAAVRRKERLERKRARSVRTAVLPGIGIEDAAVPVKRKRTRAR
ncbi:MAG: ribonuclease H-like domain-containing protein [Minicystis sp.]